MNTRKECSLTSDIIVGDCISEMRKIPDGSFKMVFADPPFNLDKRYDNVNDSLHESDYISWCEEWIKEIVRVTMDDGAIFLHNIPKWLIVYANFLNKKAIFKHWISWDAPTSPMGKSLQPSHYGILYYAKTSLHKMHEIRQQHKRCRVKKCSTLLKDYGGKKDTIHPFGPLVSDVWTDIHRHKHACYLDEHPCQLPVHLLERLILMTTNENDLILDPFFGTGTTGVAAKRLGRFYLGIDKSEKYVNLCKKRIELTESSKLEDFWVSIYINKLFTVRDVDIGPINNFNPLWKKLYENWPETKEMRCLLNTQELEFKPSIKERIKEICENQK